MLRLGVLLVVLTASANATVYWVSPSGNNSNDGLDSTTAWATIDRGDQLAILNPGDTINVLPGTYALSASATFNQSGTGGSHIVYRGYGPGKSQFDGGGANLDLFVVDASYMTFEEIELTNTNQNGFEVSGISNLFIRCVISNLPDYGVHLTAGADSNRVYNCTFYNLTGGGSIGVYPVNSVKTTRVINSIFHSMTNGIWAASGSIAAHNNMWGVSSPYFGGVSDSAGGISVDPLFVDAAGGDFSLQSSSNCIDAGMDIGEPYVGTAPDIGAVEYSPPSGNVYWVSPTGNDSNDGLDSTTAWASIDRGDQLAILNPGDTVNILSGTYVPGATIALSSTGSQAAPIVYRGFDSIGVTIDLAGLMDHGIHLTGGHQVVERIRVTNGGTNGIFLDGDSCTVQHCVVDNCANFAIYVKSSANLLLRNIIFASNNGIRVELAGENLYYGNTIDQCQLGVFMVATVTTERLFNNIISNSSQTGIDGKSGNICAYNNVWNSGSSDYSGGVADSAGGISADPLFVDAAAGDYNLQAASPCIDTALDLGYPFEGSAPDMGAIEYTPNVPTVYWVSPTGNDSNDGLDSTTAWASIDRGNQLGILLPGDTVNIMPGTYPVSSSVLLTLDGTQALPIVYTRFGTGDAIIDMGGANDEVVQIDGHFTHFLGITLTNTQRHGIWLYGDSCSISDNVVLGCGLQGIDIYGDGNLIQRNLISKMGESGLVVRAGAENNRLHGNTVYSTPLQGVWIDPSVITTRVFNNIVVSAGDGIDCAAGNVVGFNDVWNSAGSAYVNGASDSAGGISADPLFVDTAAGDFGLQIGSLCINAGLDLGYSFIGPAPDMGAFESAFANQAPVLTPIGPKSVDEGQNLNFTIVASDQDLTTPSLAAENFPANASFTDNADGTGTFDFDPDFTQAGVYIVLFITSDGALADSETVTITVSHVPGVFWVSTTGNDGNDGLDSTSAWASIDNGDDLSILDPGDTVNVLSGTYNTASSYDLTSTGTVANPIVYRGYGIGETIFRTIGPAAITPIEVAGTHLKIDSLSVTYGLSDGILVSGDSCTITNCRIYSVSNDGMKVTGSYNLLQRNYIYRSANGIKLMGVGSNLLHGNTLALCSGDAFKEQPASLNNRYFNNIAAFNGGDGFDGANNGVCAFNNAYANVGGSYQGTLADSAGGISANPLFVDTASNNFSLSFGSPAIDAGLDLGYPFMGAAPEMGAFEFDPSAAIIAYVRVELSDGTPFPDTAVTTDNDSLTLYCRAYDAGNGLLGDVSAQWSIVDSAIGTASPHIDTATTLTLTLPGAARVAATYAGSFTDTSGVITCLAGVPAYVTIMPDTATVSADSTLAFTYVTLDADSNTSEFSVVPTWSVLGSIGTINGTGTFDAVTVGTGQIVVAGAGVADTADPVVVIPGSPVVMQVLPDAVTVGKGDSVAFSAVAYDSDGNVSSGGAIDWAVLGRMGTIDTTGTFVATRSGWGRVIANYLAAGLIDTSGAIVVEAVEITAIPMGIVTAHPRDSYAPVMALHLDNYYDSDKTVDSLTVHCAIRGSGSSIELRSNVDSLGLYIDVDNDSLLSAADSLLLKLPVVDDSVIFAPTGLLVTAQTTIDLLIGVSVSDIARDGDSLDFYVYSDQIVFGDSTVVIAADSINSLGYTIIDGSLASQYGVDPHGNGTLAFVDSLVHLLTLDIPRNGYQQDTLSGFSFVNTGSASSSDFDSLLLMADNGDSLWTGAGDESLVGVLSFTGNRWTASGLSAPLHDPTTRFYVVGKVTAFPTANQTVIPQIPIFGIEVRSGNDGPLDQVIQSTDTLTIQSQETIAVSKMPVTSRSIYPGEATGPLLGIQITNSYVDDVVLDSLRFGLDLVDPEGASQAELDSQIDSVALYVNRDGNQAVLGVSDTLLAVGTVTNGAVVMRTAGRMLVGRGVAQQFTLQAFLGTYTAKDGNSVNIGLENAGDLYFDSSYALTGTFPVYNNAAFEVSAFESDKMVVHPIASMNLSAGGAETAVLDVAIPRNGYSIDSLASVVVQDLGTFDDNESTLELRLRADASNNGFTVDDVSLGVFIKIGSQWRLSGVRHPLAANLTRVIITARIKESQAEGGSLLLQIPIQGLTLASGTNGPDDAAINNTQSHLVLPADRITTIGIPEPSTSTAPGSEGNLLLSFALYNGYVGQNKTLDILRLTNISRTSSTSDYADFELGQIQLYFDRDHNRLFSGDSLMGTGYMSDGSLTFTGLDISLPPESLSYFFVVADHPLELIDSDSLAIGIASHSDLAFNEQVSLNGDVPIVKGGFAIVDGSIADQYDLHQITSRTLSPGEANVAVFSFRPALNGDMTDILQAVTLENLGSATGSDIALLELWLDLNGDGIWQLSDSLLGAMSPSGARWSISGLGLAVQGSRPLLCAVLEIDSSANSNASIRFSLPLNGCEFASANDGPNDNILAYDDNFTISYSGLSVSAGPLSNSYSVGQTIRVSFNATNLSLTAVDSVVGEMITVSNPSIVTFDSSITGPVMLAGGASSEFVFYYTAISAGTIQWSMLAHSTATSDTSATLQTKAVSIQNAPSSATVVFNDAMPTAVTRGQANVFPLSLSIAHPDSPGSTASLRLDSLRLTVEDGAGNPIDAATVLSRFTIATGQATLVSIDSIPSATSVTLVFTNPVIIKPGTQQLLSALVDIDGGATADEFVLAFSDASAIAVVDANSDLPVSLSSSLAFPTRTASCEINDPSEKLLVSAVSLVGSEVNRGQSDVKIMQIDFRHPGLPNSSQIRLSALGLRFVDLSQGSLVAASLFEGLSIVRNQFIIGSVAGVNLDASVINVVLTAPVTLNPGEIAGIQIVGDLRTDPAVSGFSMIIDDSTQFVVRDASSGAKLNAATDTAYLATGSVFPITSAVATLKYAAEAPDICLSSLLPLNVITGSDSLPLFEMTIDYPVSDSYSSLNLQRIAVAVVDSTGGPINSQQLFDLIGYSIDGGPISYLPSVEFAGSLTQFRLGDSGLVIAPGSAHTVRLIANIEADPSGIDNFKLLLPDAGTLVLRDATDTTHSPGLATAAGCPSSLPFATSLASVISRAGRPSLVVNQTPVQLAPRGKTNVTLLRSELNYGAASAEGDVLLESLTAHMVKRDRSAVGPVSPDAAFEVFELVVNNTVIPVQASTVNDSIVVLLESPIAIASGTSISLTVRADIKVDAPNGNYSLVLDDSTAIGMCDAALATAITPTLVAASYPLHSGEVAITDVDLAGSYSNYPNPFNPAVDQYTTIAFTLSEEAYVDITVYTITGDLVNQLTVNSLRQAGSHQQDTWTGLNDVGIPVTSGTYYCRITARYTSGRTETLNRKVAVLR